MNLNSYGKRYYIFIWLKPLSHSLRVCQKALSVKRDKICFVDFGYEVIKSKLKLIESTESIIENSSKKYDEVWCVFDMDVKQGEKEFFQIDLMVLKTQLVLIPKLSPQNQIAISIGNWYHVRLLCLIK